LEERFEEKEISEGIIEEKVAQKNYFRRSGNFWAYTEKAPQG